MIYLTKHSFFIFWILLSLGYGLLFIGVEFSGFPVNGIMGVVNLIGRWFIVSSCASMVIGLLCVNRWVFMICFPILLVASSIAAYFKLTMGLSLTPGLIDLAIVNNWATWLTVVSIPLILAVIFSFTISAYVVWIRWRLIDSPSKPSIWVILYSCGILMPMKLVPRIKDPVGVRIPYAFYYSFSNWWENRKAIAKNRTTYSNISVFVSQDAPDVVFIIGESLRPDHLSINGYQRSTTPLLEKDSAVISFTQITSDYLSTHVSLPHIMTRAISSNSNAAYHDQSFITIFRKAGYRTMWLSNQDTVDSYAYFMHEGDTLIQCNSARLLYNFGKWTDLDLLPYLESCLEFPAKRKLIVMHTIGSHWWYPSRYPDSLAVYTPEVDSRIISELTQEQIINSYDNSVLATDLFLYSVIEKLRDRNAVMIFISDHGESLGENGRYLHAIASPELHSIACLVWVSDEYKLKYPEKILALQRNINYKYTTEMVFHSVLDAASINIPVLNHKLSIFSNNRINTMPHDSIK